MFAFLVVLCLFFHISLIVFCLFVCFLFCVSRNTIWLRRGILQSSQQAFQGALIGTCDGIRETRWARKKYLCFLLFLLLNFACRAVSKIDLLLIFNKSCKHPDQGSTDGAVVIALASHQCGPGSIPEPDAISGLSLCWFSSLLQGFFSGFSSFPPSAKTTMKLIPSGCKLCSKVTHGPYSGCQLGAPLYAFGSTLFSCVVAVLCDGGQQ